MLDKCWILGAMGKAAIINEECCHVLWMRNDLNRNLHENSYDLVKDTVSKTLLYNPGSFENVINGKLQLIIL